MATYRTVVNVPSLPGTNETVPQPWAVLVVDYCIEHGYIKDGQKEDWLEIVGSGRYWTYEATLGIARRLGNVEADIVALASSMTNQLVVNTKHLEAHDAIMGILRTQEARIRLLEPR